jgi:biopolymer transport protein ExbD
VFLLKNFSTEGAIVAPAENLTLPESSVQKKAKESLSIRITRNTIMVEDKIAVGPKQFNGLIQKQDFMIPELFTVLTKYSTEAQKASKKFGKDFTGEIAIQGDVEIPYAILTRVMYTCGQAGYPNMNLFVYRKE